MRLYYMEVAILSTWTKDENEIHKNYTKASQILKVFPANTGEVNMDINDTSIQRTLISSKYPSFMESSAVFPGNTSLLTP